MTHPSKQDYNKQQQKPASQKQPSQPQRENERVGQDALRDSDRR